MWYAVYGRTEQVKEPIPTRGGLTYALLRGLMLRMTKDFMFSKSVKIFSLEY